MLDGFPRTLAQANALNNVLKNNDLEIDVVILLEVDDEEVVKRIMNRQKIENRNDDSEDVVRNRLNVYCDQTSPLKDFYSKLNLLKEIDGMGEISEISNRIERELDKLI